MKIEKEHIILSLIFLFGLVLRIYLSSSYGELDYDSYFAIRQTEHIKTTGVPIFEDDLSYSGRTLIFPPLFYYLLAGFSFFIPVKIALTLVPNILFSLLIILVYIISKNLTKNKTASLLAAFFTSLVPIAYSSINRAQPLSLSLLLSFLALHYFLKLEEKGSPTLLLIISVLLLLTDSSIFLLLLAFILFFIMLKLQQENPTLKEKETAIFLFFLGVWYHLVLYKKAFFVNGMGVIMKNLPAPLLSTHFQEIDFFSLFYAVGVIPLLLGLYTIYHIFFKIKNRATNLFISFAIISFLMLWFKIIPINTGLMFLSISIIILSSYSIKLLLVSFSKTKISSREKMIIIGIIIIFLITIMSPLFSSFKGQAPSKEDIRAMEWINKNTPVNSTIFGLVKEGFMINQIAKRANAADSNFLFINGINQRYSDLTSLPTIKLKSEAIRIINKYDINYLFLSTRNMNENNISDLFYAEVDCFEKVYDLSEFDGAIIYRFLGCRI